MPIAGTRAVKPFFIEFLHRICWNYRRSPDVDKLLATAKGASPFAGQNLFASGKVSRYVCRITSTFGGVLPAEITSVSVLAGSFISLAHVLKGKVGPPYGHWKSEVV